MNYLYDNQSSLSEDIISVEYKVINPKSFSISELYGGYNDMTDDWHDGIASVFIRQYSY